MGWEKAWHNLKSLFIEKFPTAQTGKIKDIKIIDKLTKHNLCQVLI